MAIPTQFEKEHKQKILFFRAAGLWLIRQHGDKYELENGSYIFSRIIWLLWHAIGIAAGMWVKEVYPSKDRFEFNNGPWIDISILLVVFYIVGPAQLEILWRNQKWLPILLPDIKKLEDMGDTEFIPQALYSKITHDHAETGSINSSNSSINEQQEDCCRDCCTKFNKIFSKLVFMVMSIAFIGFFSFALFRESTRDDTKDEWKLVVIMFYLILPMLTTWLCILLINHHAEMYKTILQMKKSRFEDAKTVRKISDYMTNMFRIFEKMSDNIFQLTLGMNFGIFVMIGIVSMFEILQGILEKQVGDTSFSDILYVIPLGLSIFHIYKVAQASDHLYHHAHHGLFLKLKKLQPALLMPHSNDPKAKERESMFKPVELVYKILKDWPPKVCVAGQFKVNYQILSAMIFFIFAYARIFIKISGSDKDRIITSTGDTTDQPLFG